MARTDDRGGSRTRARLAEVATGLFIARGFEKVTVADVARAAGVSPATVFGYFARKEDLLLDRLPDAQSLVGATLHERAAEQPVAAAFEVLALRLVDERHPLSGLAAGAVPFFQTISASLALLARARELEASLETSIATALRTDPRYTGDPDLLAALLMAAYRSALVDVVRRRLAGEDVEQLVHPHRRRLQVAFGAVQRAEGLIG